MSEQPDKDIAAALAEFCHTLASSQVELPAYAAKILRENAWALYECAPETPAPETETTPERPVTHEAWNVCPKCGKAGNDGAMGGNARCWHCVCGFVECIYEADTGDTAKAENTRLRAALEGLEADWRTKGASEMDEALRDLDDPKHTAALMAGMRLACADDLRAALATPEHQG